MQSIKIQESHFVYSTVLHPTVPGWNGIRYKSLLSLGINTDLDEKMQVTSGIVVRLHGIKCIVACSVSVEVL